MTGPIRCKKTGPPRPIPATPPLVEVLPPTDQATYREPEELRLIRAHFNSGDFRGCVEPIEALFFARRNTFHQALLQYVVALHQLQIGLVCTPRRLLGQALELWQPYPIWQDGIDVGQLRAHAEQLRRQLPVDQNHSTPDERVGWWVQPPLL